MDRLIPIISNEFYHVYNRGNNRQTLFRDAADYRAFLVKLDSALAKYRVDRIAFALMPNHFHMILLQQAGGWLARMMNAIETSYAKRYNLRHHHSGHVFQGRYQYSHIQSDVALLVVARYIHLNPVRAGLVKRPEDWEFSDFERVNGQGVLHEGGLQLKGFDYAAFVDQGVKEIGFTRQHRPASFYSDQARMKDALNKFKERL